MRDNQISKRGLTIRKIDIQISLERRIAAGECASFFPSLSNRRVKLPALAVGIEAAFLFWLGHSGPFAHEKLFTNLSYMMNICILTYVI